MKKVKKRLINKDGFLKKQIIEKMFKELPQLEVDVHDCGVENPDLLSTQPSQE
jgi:hypothetical protein